MEDITLLVSQNLKKIRDEKKLSLDKLAELTGVSKSMLAQIERGESSPTIAVVWKIANGLKISFTSLLSAPQTDTQIVQKMISSLCWPMRAATASTPFFRLKTASALRCILLKWMPRPI